MAAATRGTLCTQCKADDQIVDTERSTGKDQIP
jgi:hypothetical protein